MNLFIYQNVKQYKAPILIVLVSEILILLFLGRLAAYFLPHSRAVSLNIWELWNVWDVPHYISIASSGYQKLGDEANFIIYLPFFPLLISIFKFVFQTSYLIAGYIVSLFTSILLAIILYKLTLLDYTKKTAILTVLMLFIFPTSFFLHIPYTESLFILLSVASFYFARQKHYWISFLFIGLATATKIVGLALIPAIFIEVLILDRQNFNKKGIYNKLSILLFGSTFALSGFLIYLFLNYYLWGDFFYFTVIQKQHFYETFAPFGQGLVNAFQSLFWRTGLEKIMLGYGQIAAFFLGLGMSFYVLVKVRFSYGIFMFIVLFFSYSMSLWIPMPRYILSLFPMYIALAIFSKNVLFKYIWILFSVILLLILALIFIQYGPVF